MNRLPNCVPSDTPHDRHLRSDECECGALGRWEFGGFFCCSDRHEERLLEARRRHDTERGVCWSCNEDVPNCVCDGKGEA